MSGIINKVKDALHSDNHKHGESLPEGTHGPHSSRVANAADPRVDSDLDSTQRTTGATRVAGHGEYGSGGIHDPPVEGRAVPGAGIAGSGHRAGATNLEGTAGTGFTGTSGTTGATGAYQAEPRIPGAMGTHGASANTYGTHDSNLAGTTGAGFDSGRDGRATMGMGAGPGPAPNTAGPHKNDLLNKADPRVDSDLDGSRTVGGEKTFQPGSPAAKDPTDAAQVPPSVLRKHVGEVAVEHGDAHHGRERRNSTKTHQEAFRGI